MPRSADASPAFFRRWAVIPFTRTFEGSAKRDRAEIIAELSDTRELSGVLNKALAVWPRLRQHGFTIAPSMAAAADQFRAETDPLRLWLERETRAGSGLFVGKDALRRAYGEYAARHNAPSPSPHAMTRAVRDVHPRVEEVQRTIGGRVVAAWNGIGLVAEETL
jgi:phage/plasmid-associated DNA primase